MAVVVAQQGREVTAALGVIVEQIPEAVEAAQVQQEMERRAVLAA
jgi:hypothetical protein